MAFYTNVDSTQKHRLGTRKKAVNGNEYIYLKGVTNCADGSWVVFGSNYTATLAVAAMQGLVAIANAAVDAGTKYGWFTVWGVEDGLVLSAFDGTNGAGAFLTSTDGSLDDSAVDGDYVFGVVGQTDRDTTTGMSSFILSYPFVLDIALG